MNKIKNFLKSDIVVLASNNLGKIQEFNNLFYTYDIKIIPQSNLDIPNCDEPYKSFIENALHKAKFCAKFTNLPVIADDSGLCVHALNNNPGVYSKRYAGANATDEENNLKLIQELHNTKNRNAYYYCVLVLLLHAKDTMPLIADGKCYGEISLSPKYGNGFGYDPYFFIPNLGKNISELSTIEKNKISHRSIAMTNLINIITNHA